MSSALVVIFGAVVQVLGCASYLKDTLTGKVQPNRVSWLLWSIAPLIASAAEVKQGVGILALTTFIVGFCPLLIFFGSFVNKKSEWKLTRFDIICGVLSVIGLILWLITRVGNIAILFSIMADALAALPTIVKSYQEPETENHWPFTLGIINSVAGIYAITNWNFESYAFPIYLLIINLLIAILIKLPLGRKSST